MITQFLATVFFCAQSQCFFWTSDKTFTSQKACEAAVVQILEASDGKVDVAEGACLKVPQGERV
jgi:hypothetical protein